MYVIYKSLYKKEQPREAGDRYFDLTDIQPLMMSGYRDLSARSR